MYLKSGNKYFKIVDQNNKVIWTNSVVEAYKFSSVVRVNDTIQQIKRQYGATSMEFIKLEIVNDCQAR